jgi:glycerol-3-phosphate O-acyltransferase
VAWLAQLLSGLPQVGKLTGRFFEHLRVDDSLERALENRRGAVVFVLRSVSAVDALAVAHLAKQAKLPQIGFTHDLPWLPAALGGGRTRSASQEQALVRALSQEKTALLFLKRPPSIFSQTGRGQSEGDRLLEAVLEHAEQGNDVTFVPVVLLWTMRPERVGLSPIDLVFGPTDMPGDLRAAAQVLLAYQHGALRVGEPIDAREFIAAEGADATRYALVRRLTYALLRRVERERRAVTGPARKAPERIREEVLRSPKLTKMIADLANGDGAKQAEIISRARSIVSELAASPDSDLMTALEPLADGLVRKVFTAVDVEHVGLDKTREAARRGTIVLLPSHKSHVDYLVLSYVLRKNLLELPVVAAGDNLAFFPIGELLRRGGAFFIRRDFRGDRLYAAVVDAYVRRLLRDGWAIEFYLEGGRSRTGRLLAPKLGLLNLVVDAALSSERSVSFVPVSIGYDRLMEDFELALEKAGAKKERESARSLVAVADALKYDYGRVSVCFGEPLDLDELKAEVGITTAPTPAKRRALTNKIANLVMRGIHASTLVGAGPLVATALLDMPGRGLSHPNLVARAQRLFATAARAGAMPAPSLLHVDGRLRESAIREAALVFVRGGLVREHVPDDTLGREGPAGSRPPRSGDVVIYTVPEEARSRLDLVKGCILHFYADRALVSLAFLGARSRTVPTGALLTDAASLGRMLAHELTHLSDGPLEERLSRTLEDMIRAGELAPAGEAVTVGPGNELADAMVLLSSHASHLLSLIEVLRIAARAIRVLETEALDDKALLRRALRIGREMFLGGEIDRREAVSGPSLVSAFEAFVERGLLRRGKDRYELPGEAATDASSPHSLETQLAQVAAVPRVAWPNGGV